jgi:ABC-type lipoprotein export system ATPase subunit
MQGIRTLTVVGGKDKSGELENIRLELASGSITAIVGPTGSGKSRLLADIEWMAQNDTPTGRTILFNGKLIDVSARFSPKEKPVAQLSQNMNFVMDATVSEFLRLHAECRLDTVTNYELRITSLTAKIIEHANSLAGEPFSADTPLTALSGGQSRALMIADTAFLSLSPIVLIDEIENAGIDRKQAMELLVRNEKIVFIATHDPLLALMANQRLVIKNGGIRQIIQTTETEKNLLADLEMLDYRIQLLRQQLRDGDTFL